MSNYTQKALSGMFDSNFIVVLISLGLLLPIVEETVFRGIILRGFLKRYSFWKAIILSGLLFGIFHLNIVQFILSTLSGIVLGWVYAKSRSLLLPILGHMINNIIVVSMSFFLDPYINEKSLTILGVLGILVFLTGLLLLKREFGSLKENNSTYQDIIDSF